MKKSLPLQGIARNTMNHDTPQFRKCLACGGEGKITKRKVEWPYIGRTPCLKCDGRGQVMK